MGLHAITVALTLLGPPDAQTRALAAELRAEGYFIEERYELAREQLLVAHNLAPKTQHLFNLGRIEQAAGRCDEAIVLFERFLGELADPKTKASRTARAHIQQCRQELAKSRAPVPPEPQPVGAAADPKPVPRPSLTQTRPKAAAAVPADKMQRPWHRDPLGGVLLGTGLGVTAIGGVLMGTGVAEARSAVDASNEAEFVTQRNRGRTLQSAGIVTLVTGGALLVGAVVRYALVATTDRRRRNRRGSRRRYGRR